MQLTSGPALLLVVAQQHAALQLDRIERLGAHALAALRRGHDQLARLGVPVHGHRLRDRIDDPARPAASSAATPCRPCPAARGDVDATIKDGRVTRAAIKGEGGAIVSLSYDKKGRIKGLDEDTDGDGTPRATCPRSRGAKDNPAAKATTTKQTASVDDHCWK